METNRLNEDNKREFLLKCASNPEGVWKEMAELKSQLAEKDIEISKLRNHLKPIEEVYNKWNIYKNCLTVKEMLDLATDYWRAIKKVMEGK